MSDGATKKKVLVVDDEAETLMFLSTLLKGSGFEPIIAENELEGIEKARSQHPSCIILNAMMPEESGISLYVNLKCDQQLKTVPVIVLSSVASKVLFYMQRMKGVPARDVPEPDAFVSMPPEAAELLRLVELFSRGAESKSRK